MGFAQTSRGKTTTPNLVGLIISTPHFRPTACAKEAIVALSGAGFYGFYTQTSRGKTTTPNLLGSSKLTPSC